MWSQILARLEESTLVAAAALWQANPASLKHINHGINAVYRATAKGKTIYLRITHIDLRDQEYLALPIDFMRHALAQGAQVCGPLLSVNSCFVEEIQQGPDLFLVTALSGIAGQTVDVTEADAQLLHEWGYSLGLLHAASESYVHKPNTAHHHWKQQWQAICPALESDPQVLAEYKAIGDWLSTLPETDFGLCHADFRAANCIWDGQKVWIIDFDEPTYCWFYYDIARAMLEFSDLTLEKRQQAYEWFLEGYAAARSFDPELALQLDWFVRFRTLMMYGWYAAEGVGGKIPSGMGSGDYRRRVLEPLEW